MRSRVRFAVDDRMVVRWAPVMTVVGLFLLGTSAWAAPTSAASIQFPPVTPKERSFSEICYALDFFVPVWQLLLLWIVLRSGLSAWMRNRARALSQRRFLTLLWYMAFYTVLVSLCNLPVNLCAGFWLEHHYGLSHEPLSRWLADDGKGILTNYAIRVPVIWIVFWLMSRWPRRWEFRLWAVLVPLIAIGIFAEPLIIEPIFNKFTPLPHGKLYDQIHALAVKAGIPNAPILVSDMSRQTDETNAYVDGIGSSARIVLWDTTLKKMPEDQIVAVMGHEMGHYVLKHVYWGYLCALGFLLVVLPIVRRFYDWFVTRNLSRWRVEGPSDIAAIPALIFTYILIGFLADPFVNAAGRVIEHQADAYGLQVTHDPIAMAQAFVALSRDNLSEPNPPAFIQFWFYNHPTLQQRVDFVLGRSGSGLVKNALAPRD